MNAWAVAAFGVVGLIIAGPIGAVIGLLAAIALKGKAK